MISAAKEARPGASSRLSRRCASAAGGHSAAVSIRSRAAAAARATLRKCPIALVHTQCCSRIVRARRAGHKPGHAAHSRARVTRGRGGEETAFPTPYCSHKVTRGSKTKMSRRSNSSAMILCHCTQQPWPLVCARGSFKRVRRVVARGPSSETNGSASRARACQVCAADTRLAHLVRNRSKRQMPLVVLRRMSSLIGLREAAGASRRAVFLLS